MWPSTLSEWRPTQMGPIGKNIPIIKLTKCIFYLKLFILVKHSTCFGRSFRPSSGAKNCAFSNGICQTAAATCCYRGWYIKYSLTTNLSSGLDSKTRLLQVTSGIDSQWIYCSKIRIFLRWGVVSINPLNPELNPIWYLLALLGAHHFLHVSRIRAKLLTFRLLMSCIYGAPILDVSRSHTTTQHSR